MAAGHVPREVGDDAGEQGDCEHRDRGQLSIGSERSGNDQCRDGRYRNADLLDEYVAEDDSQSVLADDGREVVGHPMRIFVRRAVDESPAVSCARSLTLVPLCFNFPRTKL
jgi:hypothetical protein